MQEGGLKQSFARY